jgi:hypothetical protein
METTSHDTGRRIARSGGGLAGAPVLLALAFMVVTSLDLAGSGVMAFGRDGGHARAVASPLTEALVRAVRGMVGVQTQRPLARGRTEGCGRFDHPIACLGERVGPTVAVGHHVREGLLNLPPPAAGA